MRLTRGASLCRVCSTARFPEECKTDGRPWDNFVVAYAAFQGSVVVRESQKKWKAKQSKKSKDILKSFD